jgi:hypothetical protein
MEPAGSAGRLAFLSPGCRAGGVDRSTCLLICSVWPPWPGRAGLHAATRSSVASPASRPLLAVDRRRCRAARFRLAAVIQYLMISAVREDR